MISLSLTLPYPLFSYKEPCSDKVASDPVDIFVLEPQMGRYEICELLLANGARVEAYNEHKSQVC